jgi:hypothetical protein
MRKTEPPAAPASRPNGTMPQGLRRAANRKGVAATEFALASIPLLVMIIGIMEVAWQLATAAALDHAALRASRFGITGSNSPPAWQTQGQQNVPTCRSNNIRWLISQSTGRLIKDNVNLVISTAAWAGVNGSGSGSGTSGAGAGGQIVSYTITYTQPFITGQVAQRLWGGAGFAHRAFLMVKNEPFENVPC